VDDDGGYDFTRIQDAIAKASPGDTIFVYNGTYEENLEMDKGNLAIAGEDKHITIINQTDRHKNAIIIDNADYVTIKGFSIFSTGNGIVLFGASNCNISNNKIESDDSGILLWE
jgi:nitrous oxidase accessory protein